MRSIAIMLASSAILALGACDKGGEAIDNGGGAQTAQDVATEMKKISLQPGEWETTSEIVDVTMENAPQGMPPGMMDTMKGRKTTVKTCLTPEQAEKPNADFLTAQKGSNCTYSGFEMAGGTIKGNVSCTGGQGGNATVAMTGIYTPASYTMTMDVTSAGMGGPQAQDMKMHMKMKTSSKRVGECPSSTTP